MLKSDAGLTDEEIASEVHISVPTIERIRKRFCMEGLTSALEEKTRSGPPPKADLGKKMWCVPNLTPEFIARMYSLLELYERPYNPLEPVVGLDEKSKQLLDHKRPPIPLSPHHGIREDSEYIRKGTQNLFVAVEPKGKKRFIKVTEHRTKQDFANVVIANFALF